jgi:hypothetical protein
MPIPREEQGPAWLRDWGSKTGYTGTDSFSGYVDGQSLAVDITSLIAFADALQTEHEQDYRPHVREVFDGMSAQPAGPDERFVELNEVMTYHRDMLVQTSTALANHDKAIVAFVEAARAISEEYRGADAMSSARVEDVEDNLIVPATPTNPNGQTPVITPEQAAQQTTPTTTTTSGTTTTAGTTTGTTTTSATTTTTGTTTTTTGSPDHGREIS